MRLAGRQAVDVFVSDGNNMHIFVVFIKSLSEFCGKFLSPR